MGILAASLLSFQRVVIIQVIPRPLISVVQEGMLVVMSMSQVET
jgi:hypothetical protein